MKILVLNCSSSSLKYQLINMETEEVLASGKYERIGEDEAFITHKVNGQNKGIDNRRQVIQSAPYRGKRQGGVKQNNLLKQRRGTGGIDHWRYFLCFRALQAIRA